MLPLAMGAVVDRGPLTFQTPLSGQISPVRASVPIGLRAMSNSFINAFRVACGFDHHQPNRTAARDAFRLS